MKWAKNIEEARHIQHEIKKKITIAALRKKPATVAGVDAAFSGNSIIGAACLYQYPELRLLEETHVVTTMTFPYIPGFLSFREGPVILKALRKFTTKPDVILFDGQGIAHPQHTGIAAHLGVLLNIPSIGCAKSRLIGDFTEPLVRKGSFSNLRYRGKTVGAVLRTRDNVKPVFISPGHLIDIKGAIDVVLQCTGKYRIPEPLRRADYLSKKFKTGL